MTTLYAELKRRKVFRVGAVYLAGAWLLLQLGDIVFDNLSVPDWVMPAWMFVLALGFPVALVLAWAFEVSADGVHRDQVDAGRDASRNARMFYAGTAIIAAAVVGYLGFAQIRSSGGSSTSIEPNPEPRREATTDSVHDTFLAIAVLPFETLSESREDEYFADGLADTLLNKLAQLQTLTVIARNSSFQYKGRNVDVREIGRELGVPTVLEGTVQRQGDQIRVIAQLVSTENGAHWWSETFDSTFEDVFGLQDRLATAIAEQLQITLTSRDRDRLFRSGTDVPEAYDKLARAQAVKIQYDAGAYDPAMDRKLEMLREVVELDPDYALGWAAISFHFNELAFRQMAPDRNDEMIAECRAAARRAIEVDPDEEAGYVALGFSFWRELALDPAEEAYRRALELNPNAVGAIEGLGLVMLRRDNNEEALRLFQRSREIDPNSNVVYRQLYFALSGLRRIDEGIEVLKEGIRRKPDFTLLRGDLAGAYSYNLGRHDQALRVISDLVARNAQSRAGLTGMTRYWFAVDDLPRARAWLARLASRYPDHNDTHYLAADLAMREGDIQAAIDAANSLRGDGVMIFERAWRHAYACLQASDFACASEKLSEIFALKARLEQSSGQAPAAVVILINQLLLATGGPGTEDTVAALVEAAEEMASWPLLFQGGGDPLRARGYARAAVLTQLGRHDDALAELDSTLDIADGGIVPGGFVGIETNYFLQPLKDRPAFNSWFGRFDARRKAMRKTMIAWEAAGEIVSP